MLKAALTSKTEEVEKFKTELENQCFQHSERIEELEKNFSEKTEEAEKLAIENAKLLNVNADLMWEESSLKQKLTLAREALEKTENLLNASKEQPIRVLYMGRDLILQEIKEVLATLSPEGEEQTK